MFAMIDTDSKPRFAGRPHGALALMAISLSILVGCGEPATQAGAGAPPPPTVGVQEPVEQVVARWEEFSGRLQAVERVSVRPRVSGFVEKVHFDEGAIVEAGDLLYTLDPRTFRADLSRLEAQNQEAKVRLELAKSEAARVEPLVGTRAISAEEVEQRQRDVQTAEAALVATTAALERARLDLQFSRVTAPISGRVGRTMVTRGNLVSGGSGDSTVLTTMVSLDPVYFYFTPDERTARRFFAAAGSLDDSPIPVELQLEASEGFVHTGGIDFFDNQVDPATGTLQVRAVFDNPDGTLVPGMFGRVRVQIEAPRPALLVPDHALGRDQTQQLLMIVGSDGTVERRVVTTGTQVGGLRVITSGLEAGELVVVEGLQRARPGTQVTAEPAGAGGSAPQGEEEAAP